MRGKYIYILRADCPVASERRTIMTVILKAKDSRLKITKENWDQLSDNEALREFYTLEFWLPAHEKEMTKSQARRGWHLYDELSEYMASRGLISINPNIV